MGGSRIFDWGGPRIVKARDDRQNVALFALKSWPIGGGHGPVTPPPLDQIPYSNPQFSLKISIFPSQLQSQIPNYQILI